MKFELNRLTDYSNEAIIREIQRVAAFLNTPSLTISAFEKESKVKVCSIHKRFNGWKEALEAAGLDLSPAN
jgi:Homing endonuclease associated repeat